MLPTFLIEYAIRHRRGLLRPVYRQLLLFDDIDIPAEAEVGADLVIRHRGQGITISHFAVIGDRVQIYPRVTIGRSDIYRPGRLTRLVVSDDCVLGVGAVILGGQSERTLGRGTVVGANAVLNSDTGPWEIWAGNPAQKIGKRDPDTARLKPRQHRPYW